MSLDRKTSIWFKMVGWTRLGFKMGEVLGLEMDPPTRIFGWPKWGHAGLAWGRARALFLLVSISKEIFGLFDVWFWGSWIWNACLSVFLMRNGECSLATVPVTYRSFGGDFFVFELITSPKWWILWFWPAFFPFFTPPFVSNGPKKGGNPCP